MLWFTTTFRCTYEWYGLNFKFGWFELQVWLFHEEHAQINCSLAERVKEREREIHIYIYICICIYVYISSGIVCTSHVCRRGEMRMSRLTARVLRSNCVFTHENSHYHIKCVCSHLRMHIITSYVHTNAHPHFTCVYSHRVAPIHKMPKVAGHFLQKSLYLEGSFAENELLS